MAAANPSRWPTSPSLACRHPNSRHPTTRENWHHLPSLRSCTRGPHGNSHVWPALACELDSPAGEGNNSNHFTAPPLSRSARSFTRLTPAGVEISNTQFLYLLMDLAEVASRVVPRYPAQLGHWRRIGSLPSQPTEAARIASKIRIRVGVASAISITVPAWPSLRK
jgi:hypothetical protein